MAKYQMPERLLTLRQSFRDEEILGEEFVQLEDIVFNLEAKTFEDTLNVYFLSGNKLLAKLDDHLREDEIDVSEVENSLGLFKGDCDSAKVGSREVITEVDAAMARFKDGDIDRGKAAVERVRVERENLRAKLLSYFEMLNEARK